MTSASDTRSLETPARARGGLREVAGLAWPVVLSQMSSTLMGVVDTAMVGRLGPTELAAVGFAHIWTWTLFSIFIGTASGVQTFVAQHHGAGEERRCGAWVWNALVVLAPGALLSALAVGALAPFWLAALGLPRSSRRGARVPAGPARRAGRHDHRVRWASFFRGVGDTRTPMLGAVLANVVNASLCYALIFGAAGFPRLGVAGSGLAMAVGEWSYAAFLACAALRRTTRARYATGYVALRARDVRRVLRTGLPIGGQWVLDMAAFAVFTTLVARMGDASMAASQAFIALLSLSFMQASGLSVAAATLVGRYVGAGDPAAAERSFRRALGLAAGLGVTVATLFLTLPGPLLRLFSHDRACSSSADRFSRSERASSCSMRSASWPRVRCAAPVTRAGRFSRRRGSPGSSSCRRPGASASASAAASRAHGRAASSTWQRSPPPSSGASAPAPGAGSASEEKR